MQRQRVKCAALSARSSRRAVANNLHRVSARESEIFSSARGAGHDSVGPALLGCAALLTCPPASVAVAPQHSRIHSCGRVNASEANATVHAKSLLDGGGKSVGCGGRRRKNAS